MIFLAKFHHPFAHFVLQHQESASHVPLESYIDQGPYVNIAEDGMVAAVGTAATDSETENIPIDPINNATKGEQTDFETEKKDDTATEKPVSRIDIKKPSAQNVNDLIVPLRRCIDQLSRRSRISMWLLAWIAISTTWPLVGSALILFLKRRFKGILPMELLRKRKSVL